MKRLKPILLKYIPILLALVYSCLLVFVIASKNKFDPQPSDAILVLGHGVTKTGEPSPWLKERLYLAADLYTYGISDLIIVSGGIGAKDTRAVAYYMHDFLVSLGVPQTSIILEANANNTYQNFLYTSFIMQENHLDSLIVVTNDFHMGRSMLLSHSYLNEHDLSWANAPLKMDINVFFAYLREPLSIIYNFTVGRIFT